MKLTISLRASPVELLALALQGRCNAIIADARAYLLRVLSTGLDGSGSSNRK